MEDTKSWIYVVYKWGISIWKILQEIANNFECAKPSVDHTHILDISVKGYRAQGL